MGVDYSAKFGLGIELKRDEIKTALNRKWDQGLTEEELKKESVIEWFEGFIPPPNFYTFYVGDTYYGDDQEEFFICIKDSLANGIEGLKEKSNALIFYLNDLGFTTPGEVQLVGGLLIS